MLFSFNKFIVFSLFIAITGLSSCKVNSPQLPDRMKLPASYTGNLDTVNAGTLKRSDFFTDSTLLQLIDTAVYYNFDLQAAMHRITIAQADVRISNGNFLPVIGPHITMGVDKWGKYTLNGVGNFDTNLSEKISADQKIPGPTPDFFVGLRSAWEIGLWGKFRNLKKAAVKRFLATEKGRLLITTNLVSEVSKNYFELLALDNELAVIQKNIVLQQTALDMMRIMKEGGRANELGVKQFEAQLLETKALEIIKKQQVIVSENRLNFLLGRFPQPIKRTKTLKQQVLPQQVYAGIPSSLLTQRPDIQQAELELQASNADVAAARAAFLPSIKLSAYGGYNSFRSEFLFSPASLAYGALAGLTSPLWNQYQIRSNYRKANSGQMILFYNYQKSIVDGFQEVSTSLQGIENYEKIFNLKEEETVALQQAVSVSKELFTAGQASYLEVITAQKKLLVAELELSDARKEQFVHSIDLYRSLGGGWQ